MLLYMFCNIFIIAIMSINFASSYYILPFRVFRPSISDLYQLYSYISEDEIFLIYTKKMSIITLLEVNDSLKLKGYLDSSSLCSYFYSDSCIYNSEFNVKINHTNVNFSNIFDIIYNNRRNNVENDKCLNMKIGLGITQTTLYSDCISFVDEVKKNDNKINTYSWSLKYYDSNNNSEINYDGEMIIGIEPHDYQPFIYNKENYVTVDSYIDEDSYYFPQFEKNEYGIQFNSVYFYKNNKVISENLVKIVNPTSMEGLFSLTNGMIQCPEEYYNLIKINFFSQYLDICSEVAFYDDHGSLYTFVCNKNKLNIDQFYKNFPTLYFKHINLNFIFELQAIDLFREEKNKIYFMIFVSDLEKWYFGEIFLKKYFFTFNQNKKAIGFYIDINKNDGNKGNNGKENNEKNNKEQNKGIIFLIIGIVLIIINFIIFGMCLYKKICENNRRRRANELKDDNYDYLPEDNSNKNNNKIINDN